MKKLRRWLEQVIGYACSRTTLHRVLRAQRLSWKKCQKVLKKADPQRRAAFVQQFQELFARLCRRDIRLLYIDEAHLHRDMDLGYTWAPEGKPAWRLSGCASLAERINWYGAYDFSCGQCFIWNEGSCNQAHTIEFLHHVAAWMGDEPGEVVLIWDGAPWHKAKRVQAAASELGFTVVALPSYSPDLNPIEGLWKWMREEVTRNFCHASMRHLFDACKAFIDRVNADPQRLVSRLWPRFELDLEFEKFLVSNGTHISVGSSPTSLPSRCCAARFVNCAITLTFRCSSLVFSCSTSCLVFNGRQYLSSFLYQRISRPVGLFFLAITFSRLSITPGIKCLGLSPK